MFLTRYCFFYLIFSILTIFYFNHFIPFLAPSSGHKTHSQMAMTCSQTMEPGRFNEQVTLPLALSFRCVLQHSLDKPVCYFDFDFV